MVIEATSLNVTSYRKYEEREGEGIFVKCQNLSTETEIQILERSFED